MVLLVCQGAVEEYCTANMLLRFFIHLLEMFQSINETELVFATIFVGWWRGSVVERRSLAGELSLSCSRPAADG